MALMTQAQFVEHARDMLSPEGMEGLYERIAEHNSEVAAFGDSGPGTMYYINQSIADVKRIERQLARLEGRAPRDFGFRVRSPR